MKYNICSDLSQVIIQNYKILFQNHKTYSYDVILYNNNIQGPSYPKLCTFNIK